MAVYTTIDKPEDYFNTVIYSGSGSTGQTITVGFQPDVIWVKARNQTYDHVLFDSIRGFSTSTTGTQISPNLSSAQASTTGGHVGTVTSTGWTTKNGTAGTSLANVGDGSTTYVCFNWKVNGGSNTTNDASSTGVGSQDSVYQANTTSKFSIFTYGPLGSGGTIAHGLGVVPEVIWVKSTGGSRNWCIYHHKNTSAPETDFLSFDQNVGTQDATVWNDTAPTSTLVSVSGDGKVGTDETYVGYAMRSVQGFSKFGSYKGNGNDNGVFVYLGFKPAFVIIKRTSANQWGMFNNKSSPFNEIVANLDVDADSAENTATNYDDLDFLSNGFKLREENDDINASGGDYIYMAWAEHPLVSSEGVPCTAR
jgi:hypothetical protein